jgi:hypothetical protein
MSKVRDEIKLLHLSLFSYRWLKEKGFRELQKMLTNLGKSLKLTLIFSRKNPSKKGTDRGAGSSGRK